MPFSFFKKSTLEIFVPVNGQIIPLEEVPDPVFSEKMMGEGIAVVPTEGEISAPVEGTIIQIASTKHAIGILVKDSFNTFCFLSMINDRDDDSTC